MENSSVWLSILTFFVLIVFLAVLGLIFSGSH